MKNNVIKISLKNTAKYIILLTLLSIIISYITIQISLNIKYAIDGVLFNNYENMSPIIHTFLKNNYIKDLMFFAILIIILNLVSRALNYFRDRATTKLKLKINTNLKTALYKHMINLEYESYNKYDKAEIMQRINEDAEIYSEFFNSQFNIILDIIFLSIFIIKESSKLNIAISVYIFTSIIIMMIFSLWYFKKLNKSIERLVSKRKKLLSTTLINLNNLKLVRMFNKQKQEKENYKKLNDDYNEANESFIKLVLFYDIILEHITYLKRPIIFIIGGISIINGNMTIGALMALINLAGEIFNCIYDLGENLEIIDNFFVVSKKINRLLRLKQEEKEKQIYDLNGEIIFSNVTIYVEKKKILENLNFIIKEGEKVAIIGENGSGKSILAKTILGFYDYEGNIYINNHNIKRLSKENIRKYVELILGESYMFSGSIMENIALHNEIDEQKIKQAVKDTEIEADIKKFKDKYNTLIGEKGTKLSGGQKQRICIARSLVNNKPILILDEAVNKLDNKTRQNILENLKNKYKEKTIILISNNLEIINYVDNIIFIDQKTTIKGTHKELLERNKNYKKIIEINEDII